MHAFLRTCVSSLCLTALLACSAEEDEGASGKNTRGGSATAGSSGGNLPGVPGAPGATGTMINPMGLAPVVQGGDGACRSATIAFVSMASGSMCEPFGGSTRRTELRNALVAKQTGLMYRLQSVASFGLCIYDGTIDLSVPTDGASAPAGSGCSTKYLRQKMVGARPQIVEVAPTQNNAAQIDQKVPMAELGGSTPTDKAMNYTVDALLELRGSRSALSEPQYILLATDGQPNDICMNGMGGDGVAQQQGVIAAVDRAAAMGVTTFVISLASDPAPQMLLDEVARHGNKADAMARSFTPTSSTELVSTLTKLLGSAIGCPI